MKIFSILVIGQFTSNRGDQAAAEALAYGVKRACKDAVFDYLYIGKDDYVIEDNNFVKNYTINPKRAGYLFAIALLGYCFFRIRLNRYISYLVDMIKRSDLVLMPPGGPYIGDIYTYRDELQRLAIIMIAKSYSKKVMIYAPSMGPFNNVLKNLVRRFVLNRVDAVIVRDSISFDYLKGLKLKNEKIHLGADTAIQRKFDIDENEVNSLYEKCGIPLAGMKIGVTPIDLCWHPQWMKRPDIKAFNEAILSKLSRSLEDVSRDRDVNIILFPQLFGNDSDMGLLKRLKDMTQANLFIADPEFSAYQQQVMISRLDAFIGMRYHSVVFSFIMRIPFVAISYEHKIDAFVKDAGMDSFLFNIDGFTSAQLTERIKVLINDKERIKEIMRSRYDIMAERVSLSTKILIDLLNERKFHI